MSQTFLPPKWLELLCDPYAVLGVSINASERQIFKRYHALAKQLHPDNHHKNNLPDQELAKGIFTRLINPAYEELKQTKKCLETIAYLRIQVCNLNPQTTSFLQTPIVQELITMSAQAAELFYEEAIASYADAQYKSLRQSYQITQQISQLTLAYLWLQTNNSPSNNQLPTAIVPQDGTQSVNLIVSEKQNFSPVPINYAQRHYQRAIQYTRQTNWALAVQELRDAIKLEPKNSDYHALLGVVHFQQKFRGMARVYIRQALKINPHNPLALKYAAKLNIKPDEQPNPQSMAKALSIAALLSGFLSRKRF
jgi:curved DNA-binding protein CbpA